MTLGCCTNRQDGYVVSKTLKNGCKGLPLASVIGRIVAAIAFVISTLSILPPQGTGEAKRVETPPVHKGTAPSDPVSLNKVSWWPYGTTYDVAYDPDTGMLVTGSGGTILLLDVADPTQPVKVSDLVLEGQQQHIALSSGIAYITTYRRNGLQVVDVSDPLHLQTISFFPTDYVPHGIEIVGNIAYLADDRYLDILDISNPGSPQLRSQFQVSGRAAHTYMNGDKLYLTVWSEGVYVLDVSDPDSPIQVGFHSAPDVALFAVTGSLALQADWYHNTVQVFDVTDDAAFKTLSTFDLLNETHNPSGVVVDIVFSNSLAYISGEYWDHLQVVDLSDPSHPAIIGSINAQQSTINRGQYYVGAGPIILVGNLLFQSAWTCGVGIFDISDPKSIHVLGNFETPDPYLDISVSGNIACVANMSDGVRLFDVSNPFAIHEIGSLSPGMATGTFLQVVCQDGSAYSATEGWGLQIYDINQPDSPHFVGSVDTPGTARGIAVVDGFAYITDASGGLRIMDVHSPSAPIEVGFYLFSSPTTKVAVSGEYAYVGTEDGALHVVDVSDPVHSADLGHFQLPVVSSYVTSLTATENEIYLGTNDSFVYRLDISNPQSPQLKSSLAFPGDGTIEDIVYSQERVYIAGESFGLRVAAVSNPMSMEEIANFQAPGPADGVDIAGGYIYLACNDAGFLTLRLGYPIYLPLVLH
jgi:hypothetical protein